MVTSNPYGQATLAIIESQKLPHGSLFVECLYRTQCSAHAKLKIDRYLPIQTLRFVINERCKDLSEGFTRDAIARVLHPADKSQMRTFIKNRSKDIEKLVKYSQTLAINALPAIKTSATRNINQELNDEINRLSELQKHNPLIRKEEIHVLEARKEELLNAMQGLVEQLVGIRVLVNIH